MSTGLFDAVDSGREPAGVLVPHCPHEIPIDQYLGRLLLTGEMALEIGHSINQPLGTIANLAATAANLVRSGKANAEDLLDSLRTISNQCHQAAGTVRRLRGIILDSSDSIDMAADDIVREAVVQAQEVALSPGSKIALEVEPGLPRILGDGVQIRQILVSLICHANEMIDRAVDEPKSITISAARTAYGVEYRVTAAPCDSRKAPPRSGMRLAVCRAIAISHGGRLASEAIPLGGMSYCLGFPVTESS